MSSCAVDLTLRCLLETLPGSRDTNQPMRSSRDPTACDGVSPSAPPPAGGLGGPELAAVLIALCCHHRCRWPQFVGRDFFEQLGLSALDFHLLCHMSSWAVCGVRPRPVGAGKSGQPTAEDSCHSEGHSAGGGESRVTGGCCSGGVSGKDKASVMESATSGSSVAGLGVEHEGVRVDVEHPDVSREQCGMEMEHGTSTERDGMGMEHGTSTERDGMGMEHGTSTERDGMGMEHGTSTERDGMGMEHGTSTERDGMGMEHGMSTERDGMGMEHGMSTERDGPEQASMGTERDGVRMKHGMSVEHDDMRTEHGSVSMECGRGYIPHPREAIGLKCKRLIDLGRLAYLKEHGLDARLVYFVEKATSLENVMIIATPKINYCN